MARAKRTKPKKAKTPAVRKEFVFHEETDEENLPNGTHLLTINIPGRPATKKTHQRALRNGIILPSLQYVEYEKSCQPYMEDAWKNKGKPPMDFGVGVKITITLNNWVIGDEVGYAQSIGDILEKHGVISNDKYIHWFDREENMLTPPDKDNPGCVVEIIRWRHPYEEQRKVREEEERKKLSRKATKMHDKTTDNTTEDR